MIDDLEHRLRAIDPCPPDVPTDRADSPSAQALMERIMDSETDTDVDSPAAPPNHKRRFNPRLLAAAAVAALVVGALVALAWDRSDTTNVAEQVPATSGPASSAPAEPDAVATFSLVASDPLTQMCLPVADAVIPPGADAFAGTVTSTEPAGTVTLDVDRWYTAGDADVAVLESGTDVSVALDGVEFVVGQQYLVTVVDGTVAICGVTGPTSAELEQLYEGWYG